MSMSLFHTRHCLDPDEPYLSVGLLSLLLVAFLPASPAAGQQTVCEGQDGAAAISCIQANHSPTGTLGYDTARDTLYDNIDADDAGQLEGVYSEYTITLTPGEDPSADAYNKGINTERVYLQSKGAGSEPRKSDMHNLCPARSQVNSARGNLSFGESPDEQTSIWYFEENTQSGIPESDVDAWSERLGNSSWEPRESREGDVARATLYSYAVYQSAFEGMKDQLLVWHEADPPTDAERARSEAIAQRQGNENPFVLDPTLADRAFPGDGGEEEPPSDSTPAEALYISELADAEDNFKTEFFEVYNDSSGAVNLAAAGGKIVQDLRNGDQVFVFDFGEDEGDACESTVVPKKGTLVIARGAPRADFEAEWGALPDGANYCAFSTSFFPGTDERSWELRAGGTPGEPNDGALLDDSPQFDNMEDNRAYQDLSRDSSWVEGEAAATATPGRLDDGQVLPVELAAFAARQTGGGTVRLAWQTAAETDNAGFEVQRRSEKGKGWRQVGYVASTAAGGTTTVAQSYGYTVDDLPAGPHRFRLKQVDLDGQSTLTGPIRVTVEMREAVTLTPPAPNPASTDATLSFAVKERAETTIMLYNTLGQRVATVYAGTPPAGEQQTTQFDATGLSSGTYFLRIRANGQTQVRRLTVVR
ncbi:MAG: hypothetical protein BRD41_03510 [Bacteroidetes bacterium QS_1_63_11]|nr:MAG: hypothetical protein BRD41_03510 [Bacteroidetes bacterium QS_1_63_11]